MKYICGLLFVSLAYAQLLLANTQARLEINPQGEQQFTLLQTRTAVQSEPLLKLTWPNSPSITCTGPMISSYWNGEQLFLLMPKTIFLAPKAQNLQLNLKAPHNFVFISMAAATGNSGEFNLLMRNTKDGRFVRQLSDGTQQAIPAMEAYRKVEVVLPWASPKHPLLWIPQQLEVDQDMLCVFSPDFENCRFVNPDMGGLPAGISETQRGVWFLPEKGIQAKLWDGRHLKSEQLPVVEGAQTWLSLAESQAEHYQGLLETQTGLAYWNGKTSQSLGDRKSAQVRVLKEDRPLWQQALLFAVMVSSFLVVLHWRQEAKLQRRLPVNASVRAPIWRRSLAFSMDFFILQTPTYLVSKILHLPQPTVDIEVFALQTLDQKIDVLYDISESMIYTLIIMMVLAFIYNSLMEYFLGGSLGKLFFSIRVESDSEAKLQWTQIVLRNLLKILDYLLPIPPSLICAAFSKEKRSLADRCSKTRVIQLL